MTPTKQGVDRTMSDPLLRARRLDERGETDIINHLRLHDGAVAAYQRAIDAAYYAGRRDRLTDALWLAAMGVAAALLVWGLGWVVCVKGGV